jgi:hypothetical protein
MLNMCSAPHMNELLRRLFLSSGLFIFGIQI